MSLCGRVAVITGGARGLGKAYAEALLQKQAKVVLGDVLESAGQATAEEFNATYGPDAALYVYTDVTKQDSVDGLYQAALDKYHRVDIVINNAGVSGKDMPWQVTMDINFNGIARSSETAVKHMSKDLGGHGGTLVNIGSVAGLFVNPGGSFYTASKHAVVGFTKSLAMKQTETSGIKVHCLCPSFVKTPMTEKLQELIDNGDPLAQKRLDPYGGWVCQEDVVSACMVCIEQDLAQGAVVMVTGHGTHYVDTPLKKTAFP